MQARPPARWHFSYREADDDGPDDDSRERDDEGRIGGGGGRDVRQGSPEPG